MLAARVHLLCRRHRNGVFECAHLQGDERLRLTMHKVRRSWTTDLFPMSRLYGIDIKVREIDPAWPVAPVSAAQQSASASESTPAAPATHTVHVNPRFLQKPSTVRTLVQLRAHAHVQKSAPVVVGDRTAKQPISDEEQLRQLLIKRERLAVEARQAVNNTVSSR